MTIKPSLIFDLDGTLIDVKLRYWTVYKMSIESIGGIPLPIDQYWREKRRYTPIADILSHSLRIGPSGKKMFLTHFLEMIEQPKFLTLDTTFPYTHHVLTELFLSFRLHLVTVRRNKEALHQQLHTLQLTPYFETILTQKPGDDPAKTKRSLIKSHNISAMAIIGDTQADIGAAHELSIQSIAVTNGMRTKQFLLRYNPTYIIPSIRYLPTYLKNL